MLEDDETNRVFRLSLLVMLLSACLFSFLAWQLFVAKSVSIDPYFVFLSGDAAHQSIAIWMVRLSFLGSSQFLFPAYAILVIYQMLQRKKINALVIALTGIGGFILSSVLKTVFSRNRPLNGLMPHPSTFSFPSGHSTSSMTFFLLLAFFVSQSITDRVYKIVLFVVAILFALGVGVSRIYLNVHYPSDVLAGFSLALCWLSCMRILYLQLDRHRDSISSR